MSQITWTQQSGYVHSNQVSDMLRESLRAKAKMRQFTTLADGEDGVEMNAGDTFYWNVYNKPPRKNYRLTENVRVPSETLTKMQRSVTVVEMGGAIEHTQKAQTLSRENWEGIIESGLSYMTAAQFDAESFLQFDATVLKASPTGGTSTTDVDFATTGTPATTNNVALGTGHVKAIVDYMKLRNIPPHRDCDGYYCVSRVDTLRGIKNDLESIHQYTDTGLGYIKFGEIGRYEDTCFVEQNMIPAGGANDSTTFDPYTDTGDPWNNAKSSWAMFFGDDPVTEAAVIPEEIRAKLPEDYGRDKGAAWYSLNGFAITHPDAENCRIVKWDSAA